MTRDPLWLNFPRWIQESGIPLHLTRQIGLDAWIVFRKLVELDCDINLTPDWCSVCVEDLSRWTGVEDTRIGAILGKLEENEWIERVNTDLDVQNIRIICPMPVDIDENAVRQKMAGQGIAAGRFVLRYMEDLAFMEKIERVVYLYQMLFGAKFSPRIVEDLEEISNNYPMEIIYQLFHEAFQKKAKTLAWIKTRLSDASSSEQPEG